MSISKRNCSAANHRTRCLPAKAGVPVFVTRGASPRELDTGSRRHDDACAVTGFPRRLKRGICADCQLRCVHPWVDESTTHAVADLRQALSFLPGMRIAKRITLSSHVLNRSLERLGEVTVMNSYRAKLLVASVAAACLAATAQAQPISKAVQAACKEDYKQYCSEYGLETSGLRSCMD